MCVPWPRGRLKYNELEFWVIYTNFVNLGRKMLNITTPGNEESLRKWFPALLESCLLSREIGEPWWERRKTLWLACKVQIEHISCLLPSMQLWLQSGTRWAERRYQTFCHWKHRTQPMLPATFFVRQDVFITKDTSYQEIRCKEGCKITKNNINRQHQNQRRCLASFIKKQPF